MSRPASCFSAPTSRLPPRTRASPAIRTRLSSTLSAALLIVGSSTIQPSWMRPSPPNSPSIAPRASRVSTTSAKPPAAPKASRKNLSLLAEARALSASRSRQRARISGSCSSASNSMPLLSAPTGRQQIVAQARAEQAGEFVGFHARLSPCRSWPCSAPIGRLRIVRRCKAALRARHLEIRAPNPHLACSNVWGAFHHHREDRRGRRGWRLDRALAAARADVVARAAEGADLQRRGARAGRARRCAIRRSRRLPGGSYEVTVPAPRPAHNEAQDIALEIVFEDEHLLVVDKPAGMVVHPAAGNFDGTLVNALLHHCAGRLSAASAGWRGRASSTGSTRTRPGCWWSPRPTSPMRGWPRSSPGTASTGAIWRSSRACPIPASGHDRRAARPLVGEPQEDRDRRGRARQEGGDALSNRAAAAGTPLWSNAGSKPAAPTRCGSIWPRSAIPCSATRFMADRARRIASY